MKQCTKCKGIDIQQKFVGWYNLKEDTTDDGQYYEDEYWCKDCNEAVNVADTVNYEIGDKVKFIDDLERYPHTTIPKDATGTIADIDEDFVYVTIHDEDCAKDLAEWDGQLYLSNTPVTDFDKHPYEGLDSIEKV